MKNITIVMVNYKDYNPDTDYSKKYNINKDELRIFMYDNYNDLMQSIDIAINQIEKCNEIIIDKC